MCAQVSTPKTLCFEGAGARGLAYVGAYSALQALNKIDSVENLVGTSAGAIIALCINLGYTPTEMQQILSSLEMQKFNDGAFFFLGGLHRLNKNFGYYRGRKFSAWLSNLIGHKTNKADITFSALQKLSGKNLIVTGTSLNNQKLIIFNAQNYPDMQVRDAVRISMSVPLYFEPLIINDRGAIQKNKKQCELCDVMVDGGLLANYPIHVLDTIVYKNGINIYKANPNTLGFRIDANQQVLANQTNKTLVSLPLNNLKQYVSAMYNIQLEGISRQLLSDADWYRTISIPDNNISPKVHKMHKKQIHALVDNGYAAVIKYYSAR